MKKRPGSPLQNSDTPWNSLQIFIPHIRTNRARSPLSNLALSLSFAQVGGEALIAIIRKHFFYLQLGLHFRLLLRPYSGSNPSSSSSALSKSLMTALLWMTGTTT